MSIENLDLRAQPEFEGLEQTNWWIVTGGPSTGKSSLLANLAARGYKTMPEAARDFIDTEMAHGKTIEEIRADETGFQIEVLHMKEQREEEMPTSELVLWDRGLHGDSMAYWVPPIGVTPQHNPDDMYGDETVTVIKRRYKGIFLLDRLPTYEGDYARVEDDARAAQIHKTIDLMYRLLGYEPIKVPVLPIEVRAQFIIDRMRSIDPSVPDLPYSPTTAI